MSRSGVTRLLSRVRRQHEFEGNQRSVLKTRDLLVESWEHGEKIRDTRYKAQGTVI